MKALFITLLVVAVVGAGGYFGYGFVYDMAEDAGYDAGYPAGHAEGYASGQEAGYTEGYETGNEDGYEIGYETGYETGETEGYDTGYEKGTAVGYDAGRTAGYTSGREVGYETGYGEGVEDGLGHGYTIADATLSQVLAFMRADRTDENPYIEGDYNSYVCSHYTRDVCNAAEEQGIRAAFVEVRYPDSGHAIVAFNTIDSGLVYFEPQSDERVEPVIGTHYYQCVIPNPGFYYAAPDYDDTILDLVLVW